jgi:hypothetical protein
MREQGERGSDPTTDKGLSTRLGSSVSLTDGAAFPDFHRACHFTAQRPRGPRLLLVQLLVS